MGAQDDNDSISAIHASLTRCPRNFRYNPNFQPSVGANPISLNPTPQHDLRRTATTATRDLRKAGVAEGIIMKKIGGWRTWSVFERYAIVSQSDIADALVNLESEANKQSSDIAAPTEPS